MSRPGRIIAAAAVLLGVVLATLQSATPDDIQALIERGTKAFQSRDFKTAEQSFTRAAALRPDDSRVWKVLGMAYAADNRPDLAEPAFRRACAINNKEENACYYHGRSLYTTARFQAALAAFRIALRNPGNIRGRVLLGIALTYEAMSDAPNAEAFYKLAIEAGEKQAQVDYGLFLYKEGRSKEGIALLERAGAKEELERVRRQTVMGKPHGSEESAAAPVVFEAKELPMVVRNGATGKKYLPETMIAGVAVLDYDNDGWPDIYVCNGASLPELRKNDASWSNRLYRNNHEGSFVEVTEKAGVAGTGYSMGVAAGDFDNDGYTDVFVTGVAANTLFRNRGDGTFEDVTAGAQLDVRGKWSVAAAWLDFDNDGLLDLFVVRYVDWDPAKEIFCGATPDPGLKRAGYRQYCAPGYYKPLANALYRNLGGGKFRDISQESGIASAPGKGMGAAFGDYDGDGKLDIFIANDTIPNFLFHNEGSGRFREAALSTGVALNADGKPVSSMGVEFRDLDNDGLEDIFVTALSNETFPLFRNLGSGQFADATYPSGIGKSSFPWTGWSTGAFDLNNDGRKDLFVAGGHVMDNAELSSGRSSRQPNLVFLNQGNMRFSMQKLPGDALHRGAAFGDFDRDGQIDVVVTRLNEHPLVLFNHSAPAANWVRFRLTGRKSNRDAAGAIIHIRSASSEQWNRVTTSAGYAGSNEAVVHFGLGRDEKVSFVEIRWPSGIVQKLNDLNARMVYAVEEPGDR